MRMYTKVYMSLHVMSAIHTYAYMRIYYMYYMRNASIALRVEYMWYATQVCVNGGHDT